MLTCCLVSILIRYVANNGLRDIIKHKQSNMTSLVQMIVFTTALNTLFILRERGQVQKQLPITQCKGW